MRSGLIEWQHVMCRTAGCERDGRVSVLDAVVNPNGLVTVPGVVVCSGCGVVPVPVWCRQWDQFPVAKHEVFGKGAV